MIQFLQKLIFFPFQVVWAPFQFISWMLRKLYDAAPKPALKDGWWDRTTAVARRHYLTPIFIIALALFFPWLWLVFEVVLMVFEQVLAVIPKDPDTKRAHFYALGLTFTGLGALLAPPFILIKAWVNERQTTATEQGLITDRLTRAVEQLGAMRDVKTANDNGTTSEESKPNIEVRLGALYALERIAQDSERDHIPIMEILCAYIRENAPGSGLPDLMDSEWEPMPNDLDEAQTEARKNARRERFNFGGTDSMVWKLAQNLPSPRADIQTALTIIGRRSTRRQVYESEQKSIYQLDLRSANLQRADLTGLAFGKALLTKTRMEGAILRETRLEGAKLFRVRLEGANLIRARLDGAMLFHARLEGANLNQARLDGADLQSARLDGTHLREARLEGASLIHARLDGANLNGADFTEVKNMTQDQVNAIFGDKTTKLPSNLTRTNLLNNEPLENQAAGDPAYDDWIARGAPSGVPLTEPGA